MIQIRLPMACKDLLERIYVQLLGCLATNLTDNLEIGKRI